MAAGDRAATGSSRYPSRCRAGFDTISDQIALELGQAGHDGSKRLLARALGERLQVPFLTLAQLVVRRDAAGDGRPNCPGVFYFCQFKFTM